jgi:O-antigen/teichoic acid export membrane protein
MSKADEPEGARSPSTSPAGDPSRLGLKRILINTVTSQVDRAVDAVVFLILIPFVVHTVGTEEWGLWSLIWAVVSLFALIDLGFSTSVVKYVADARGKRDVSRLRSVISTLFWVFVAQSALLALVSLSLFRNFDRLFELPQDLRGTAEFVFLVVAGGFLMKLPMAMFRGVLVGDQKTWLANAYHIATNLLYFGTVLLVLPHAPSLRTFAWLNWIATLLPAALVTVHCVLFMRSEVSVSPRWFDWGILREIWGFSFYLMLIQLAALVGSRVDTFVVKSALPLTAVAVYAIALRVSDEARNFCIQITRTLTPVVAELNSAGAQERLVRLWLTGTRFTVAFAAPLLLGCAVLAQPLLITWMGPDFEATVVPLQLLLLATFGSLVHGNSQSQLSMGGDQRFLALAMILGQVMNLGLSLGFVVDFGLAGVAAASLVGPLATDLCLVQPRIGARFGVSLVSFYRQALLPSVVPCIAMVAVQHTLRQLWRLDALWEVALLEAINVAVFWAAFWWLGVAPHERALVVGRVRGRWQRAMAR